MNDHDADIARLFAQVEPSSQDTEFAAAVRLAINRQRRKAHLFVIVGAAAIVLIVTVAVLFIPFGSLYPIRVAQEFLTLITGMFVCAGCAVLLTIWLRVAEA